MKHFLLFIICALFSAHFTPIAGQTENQIRQEICKAASSMKTMQCEFVQTKHLKMLNGNMISNGRMFYQKPNQLRWEYISPYTYIFIQNNDKVLLKNNKRNDVIDINQNKVFKEITHIMMNSVIGNSLTDDKSFESNITVSGGEWIASLTPKTKDLRQMFKKIVLHFSQKNAIVTQVEMIEKNGDNTIIDLKNIRINERVSANMFTIR